MDGGRLPRAAPRPEHGARLHRRSTLHLGPSLGRTLAPSARRAAAPQAGCQYQQRETTHGTACCFADLGVQIIHDVHERYDFKGPWDAYGKESTDSRRSAVRNRTASINNAYLHAKHNAKAMARPKQEKSEARWRDYAADKYYHYYYRYGEDEKGAPLADDHRRDDLLELAAEAVKSLTSYKHYEGGKTARGVGEETGFAFSRRRLGCYCVPAAGASCCHVGWTGEADRGAVQPASAARSGTAPRVAPAAKRSGPSQEFRQGIEQGSLLCMPGDEEDETADGESIWFVNALGPQARRASRRRARSAAPRLTPPRPHARHTLRRRASQRPVAPACLRAGEEHGDRDVRPVQARQGPLQRAHAVVEPRRAHRRVRDLLGLADGAGPHRRHAPDGRARPQVGQGGGRPALHGPRAV